MREKLESVAALFASVLFVLGALALLAHLVSGDGEAGLTVSLDGPPILGEETLFFHVDGERARASAPPGGRVEGDGGLSSIGPGALSPGLHTVAWSESYMGRRQREAFFTVLSGPFSPRGAEVECGIGLAVGGGMLDPLSDRVEREILAALKEVTMLPSASSVSVATYFVDSGVDVLVDITFREGSRINTRIPLSLTHQGGAELVVGRRGEVQATIGGTLGTLASLRGGGLSRAIGSLSSGGGGLSGALQSARQAGGEAAAAEIQAEVDRWLPALNDEIAGLLPRSVELSLGRASVVLDLSFCEQPIVSGRAMAFRFHAKPTVTVDGVSSAEVVLPPSLRGFPGPVSTRRRPPAPPIQSSRSGLTITLGENLVNALLHELWLAGVLEDLLAWDDWVEIMNAELASFSTLSVGSVGLDLPPVLRMEEGSLSLRVGELRLRMIPSQTASPSDLVAALDGSIDLSLEGSRLRLGLSPSELRASCSTISPGGRDDLRRPCLSDLLQEAERRFQGRGSNMEISVPLEGILGGVHLTLTGFGLRSGALDLVATQTL